MKVDTAVNYDELCGKQIKRNEGGYIVTALQTIIFSLVLFIKNITYYLRDYLLIFLNQKIDISMIINTYTQLLLLPYILFPPQYDRPEFPGSYIPTEDWR